MGHRWIRNLNCIYSIPSNLSSSTYNFAHELPYRRRVGGGRAAVCSWPRRRPLPLSATLPRPPRKPQPATGIWLEIVIYAMSWKVIL